MWSFDDFFIFAPTAFQTRLSNLLESLKWITCSLLRVKETTVSQITCIRLSYWIKQRLLSVNIEIGTCWTSIASILCLRRNAKTIPSQEVPTTTRGVYVRLLDLEYCSTRCNEVPRDARGCVGSVSNRHGNFYGHFCTACRFEIKLHIL